MPETKNRKPAASTPKAGKAPAKSGTVTVTAASKAPAKSTARKTAEKKSTKTATAASGKPAPKKDKPERNDTQQTANVKQRNRFSEQFLPYIFGGTALILSVCFILNAVGRAETPDEHLMGFVGYYLCMGLFGLFGWTAYLIPLVFVNLAIFWRRYCEEGLVAVKVILSVLLMVLISAVIHVGVCTSEPALAKVFDPAYLFTTGAAFESGGIVGGIMGNLMYTGLKLPGSIALTVVALPLMIMLLVGVTPAFVFSKIRAAILAWRKKRAEDKAARLREEEAEAEAARKAEVAETYRQKRARMESKARRAVAENTDADGEDEEDIDGEASDEGTAESFDSEAVRRDTGRSRRANRGNRRTGIVDMDTGEVLDETADDFDGEEIAALPLHEPAVGSAKDYTEPTADPAFAEPAGKTSRMRDGDLDWSDEDGDDGTLELCDPAATVSRATASAEPCSAREAYADDEEEYEGEMESVTAELDNGEEADAESDGGMGYAAESDGEEVSLTAAEKAPGVGYTSLNADGSLKASAGNGTTVTILRADGTAVPEKGLSEEELVLPTTFEDEPPAEPAREYLFPSVDMLARGSSRYEANDAEIAANTQLLREVLESFHIRVKEISCSCGPTITRFEVKPESGIRVRSIANLVDDIAMNLAKAGVRIEAPIPGKAAVGIEVPNAEPATVYFRNILETPEFRNHKSRIAACLGADVSGRPVILDINKMPHLLIAGATGMGKSVCINSIIMSLLYKAKPDEVKLILIDPKKVEFSMYRELPHLLCPIVSDPKQAAGTLYCAVNEMERRFGLIEEVGVRNLAGYNEITAGDPERPPMPQIVIIIDELADLMMTAPGDVETAICRLAQKARAAGIHLVIGTQRPSVDVITGLIKANIPSRIAFTVASAVDSRTIIDTVGADKLIGRGDMLYAPVGLNKPMRCQGTFVSESEVERVVSFIKEHNDPVVYDEEFIKNIAVEAARCGIGKKKGEQMSIDDFDGIGGGGSGEDAKFWEALEVVVTKEKIGTSALQRALKLGYGRAAGIIDRMEEYGFVGPDPKNKTGRDVLITYEQLLDYKANGLPGHRNEGGSEDDFDGLDDF